MENWSKRALDINTLMENLIPTEMKFAICTVEKPNEFGGNPTRYAEITYSYNNENVIKTIDYQMAACTEDAFINKIKAYCLDVLVRYTK